MGTHSRTFGDAGFVASNGVEVKLADNGGVEICAGFYRDYTPPAATIALREFFAAQGAS